MVLLAQMTRERFGDQYLDRFGYFDPGAGWSEFITRVDSAHHQIGEFISQIARRSRFRRLHGLPPGATNAPFDGAAS
jgi:hypothetical protein